jgi:hypothetical protein
VKIKPVTLIKEEEKKPASPASPRKPKTPRRWYFLWLA